MSETNSRDAYERIFTIIRTIPRGWVATYGQIAALAGLPGHARQVGYALRNVSPTNRVPWQRVINAQGRVACRADGADEQRRRLDREGVKISNSGRIDLDRYLWDPGPEVLAGKPIRKSRTRLD